MSPDDDQTAKASGTELRNLYENIQAVLAVITDKESLIYPKSNRLLSEVLLYLNTKREKLIEEENLRMERKIKHEPSDDLPEQTMNAALVRNVLMVKLNESVDMGDRATTIYYARELVYLEEHADEY